MNMNAGVFVVRCGSSGILDNQRQVILFIFIYLLFIFVAPYSSLE